MVSKIENCSCVDKLIHDNENKHLGLEVVSQQPPFAGVNIEAIEFVAQEPRLLKQQSNCQYKKRTIDKNL